MAQSASKILVVSLVWAKQSPYRSDRVGALKGARYTLGRVFFGVLKQRLTPAVPTPLYCTDPKPQHVNRFCGQQPGYLWQGRLVVLRFQRLHCGPIVETNGTFLASLRFEGFRTLTTTPV